MKPAHVRDRTPVTPGAKPLARRQFLRTAGLSAGSVIAGMTCAGEGEGSGFVDAHSHIWSRDIDAYPLTTGKTLDDLDPPSFTPEELLATAQPHGVTRIVLIQHRPFHGVDNTYLTDTIARYAGIFSGVACVDAQSPELLTELGRLQRLGVRGFRIRPGEGGAARWQDSPGIVRMWRFAAEEQLAICPLINPEQLSEVDGLCQQSPDTPVVVDHFARIGIEGEIREADLRNLIRLARHPRTYIKVSAFYALGQKQPPHHELRPMIRRLCDAFGPQRLMWGSDSPYQLQGGNSYGASIALIHEGLDFLTGPDREWLLRKAAERVYFT